MIREHKAELLAYLQSGSGQGHESPLPFLDDQGKLRIPLNADDKYRYWQGGQSVFATLLELGASDKEIAAHIGPISTPESWRRWQKIKAERQDSPEPSDNERAGVEMFAEMIREMRQKKGREINDKCMKDIENAPNPQAAFVRAAIDIQPG